jgi:hypothetical protein
MSVTLFIVLASVVDAMALERWLVPDDSQCADDTTLNPCHTTLSDAVTDALAGDSIRILPGTYTANVTLTAKNITIFGVETARTFLTAGGGTAIIVDGVTALMKIRNITFLNASPAILVRNVSTQVTIENNVFGLGSAATAIQVLDTSSPVIMHNTFYRNGTAVLSTPNTLSVINNIFVGNSLAISANVVPDNILNNLFFQNSAIGPTGIIFDSGDPDYKGNVNTTDPQFVNPTATAITDRDFHLKSKTPDGHANGGANSINGVSPPDMGAYGGADSDTVPFPILDLTGAKSTTSPDDTIDLTWTLNQCYFITGYKIFFSADKPGPPYDTTLDGGNITSVPHSIGPLTLPTPPVLTEPVLASSPESGTLVLTWTPSIGATGYNLFYKESTAVTFTRISVGNATTYRLTGLKNPSPQGTITYYDVYVEPFYQTIFRVAVKPYYDSTDTNKIAIAFSNEARVPLGPETPGPVSDTITDFPEAIAAQPNLPNKGCFIATAAYGHYSAPQVQALRDFRDAYLLTNAPGRAFVRWYYEYGPVAAQFITEHPWLKPVVRTALLPVVGMAMFMTKTSSLGKMMVLSILIGGIGYSIYRRNLLRSGGRQ